MDHTPDYGSLAKNCTNFLKNGKGCYENFGYKSNSTVGKKCLSCL